MTITEIGFCGNVLIKRFDYKVEVLSICFISFLKRIASDVIAADRQNNEAIHICTEKKRKNKQKFAWDPFIHCEQRGHNAVEHIYCLSNQSVVIGMSGKFNSIWIRKKKLFLFYRISRKIF